MCGLAGFIGYPDGVELAVKVNEIQFHRGPDHQGIWSDDRSAFAHQRLAIIDLSDLSNQPLEKADYVIVFNGEIYNYMQLRSQLVDRGVTFDTASDTEVVLELYRHEGEECLQQLIGMFAFAIYQKSSGETFLARDHFGIKPLFYTSKGSRFAFASELKTLIKTGVISTDINYKSLVSSLNYLWVSGNETMFVECRKLPPGHCMRVTSSGDVSLKRYWSITGPAKSMDMEEACIGLSNALTASIDRHMVADVPVSSFLSGGLDSSLISVLAAKQNSYLTTFTIGTSAKDKKIEQMPEDERYARELAAEYGFDHNEIVINPDIVKILPFIVRALDEPIGDPAAINTYLICKAAHDKGVKVLLSGMGADELFFGYRRQQATLHAIRYQQLPQFIRTFVAAVLTRLPVRVFGKGIRLVRWGRRFLEFANLPVGEAYMRSYSYYSRDELAKLLGGRYSKEVDQLYAEHREIFDSQFKGDPVNQICNTDIHMFMLGLNLTYTDRASMAASVEVRVPFIDREMISYAMQIPGELKYRHSTGKFLLKKVAEAFLPKEIVYRPKASFGAPIRSWISGALRDAVDQLLSRESVEHRGIAEYAVVKRMIDEDRKGIADHAYRIYQLLTLELWFREFVD
ncbi:MAG: asparagine synthase (glutamine-hydrolyzing) [Gammaproteobacteria bacterium]|nr:asparagine synthase (glutamine-hydrolyzing) [Gammaproteobacteria bacterium]